MIQPNLPRAIRRRMGKRNADGQQASQQCINRVLWKIIAQNGGKLTIPATEVDEIPVNAAVKVTYESATGNVVVISVLSIEKGKVIVRDSGIII